MLGINEHVPYLVRFTEASVAEWSTCRTFGDPGVAFQQQRFFLGNPEFTSSCLGRGWEDGVRGGGGEVQLGRMVSTSHLLSTRAVPASSPSPTTSWTCLFCRPKLNPRPRLQITNLFSPASGVPVMGSIGLFSSIHLSGVSAGQLES